MQAIAGQITILGTKSPLIVDFEETADRLGAQAVVLVSVDGAVRALGPDRVVQLGDLDPDSRKGGFVPCAFSPYRRRELCAIGAENGMLPGDPLVDPTAIVARSCRIGDGSFVNAGVVIGGATMIGECTVINRATSIGHHCILGDFVSLAPGVTLAGNVTIHENAVIGTGSTILPDITIGAGAIVAAGSVVRQSVPDNGFVAGNPAVPKQVSAKNTVFVTGTEE